MSAYACSFPATTSRATCVSMSPGFTAFTRMPCFTYSSAAVRVRPTTPVLRGDVRADPGIAGQRTDRSVVDDRAASLTLHLPQLVLHAASHAAQIDPDHP